MSTYVRSPRKLTVHCPVAGCKWMKTAFERPRITAERLGRKSLAMHIAKKHPNLRNVMNAQELRPVMR